MPGCGKSTLGRALEAAGAAVFVDIDSEIEAACGMSVTEIFATLGENTFRRLETETLKRIASKHIQDGRRMIVSTGGGLPCHGDNMQMMLATGTVVWMQSAPQRTVERLAAAPGQRPAADRAMAEGRLRQWHDELLEARTPYYSLAQTRFDSTELDDAPSVARAVQRFCKHFMPEK